MSASLVLALASGLTAQAPSPWRFWDSGDGFMESYTSSVGLGADGSVWVKHGTLGPIELLDGYGAPHYPEPGGSGKLETAPDGTLWIWAGGRIKRYSDSAWTAWPVNDIQQLGTLRGNAFESSDLIYDRIPGMQGTIHVGALDRSHALILLPDRILEFDAGSGSVRLYLTAAQTGLVRFASLAREPGGSWIVTGRGGLGRLRPDPANKARWEAIRPPDGYVEFDFPAAVEPGRIFVTGQTAAGKSDALCSDGAHWRRIYRGESRNLRVWPGHEGIMWVQDGNHVVEITADRRTGVPREQALSGILIDVEPEGRGRFWVATSQGLSHYMPALWRAPADAPPLDDVVNSITEDRQGRIWFLAAHALLCLDESRKPGSRWSVYPLPRGETAWAVFTESLAVLGDGRVLVRPVTPHLLLFDPRTKTFEAVRHPGSEFTRLVISGPDGRIMTEVDQAGGAHTTIETFDGKIFEPFIGEAQLGGRSDARSLSFGPRGEIWMGSTTGFGVWRAGKFHSIGPEDGFQDRGAYYVYRAPDGRMFAGGRDSLYRLDGNRWRPIQGGLDRVRNVLTARDGTMWVASGTGIHRYRGGAWLTNTDEEGLPSSVVYRVFEDSKGRIWAGTTRGLSLFHPDADTEPPVVAMAEDQNPAEAPPGGAVRLVFSGVDKWKFTPAARLLFSWRMDGGPWSAFAPAASASFSGIPAGRHVFEVRSMDRNGNISLHAAAHRFAVMLPWYSTPQFRLLATAVTAVIAVLLIIATVSYRHRGRLIVELNRKNRIERRRQRILQMIAGREPLPRILEQIAIGVATPNPGARCAIVIDQGQGGGVESFFDRALPEPLRDEIARIGAARMGDGRKREELSRAAAPWLAGRCELISFGSENNKDSEYWSGILALFFHGNDAAPPDTRLLLESFGGLAAGAVDNAHLYRQLDHQARHDVLTGLANRLCFEERVEAAVQPAAGAQTPFSILYIDLDRFKQINDTLGHRVGDLFLCQVAARFANALSPGETLFRIGGDEFTVLIEQGADRLAVETTANRLLSSLQIPIRIEGRDLFSSASIGVSLFPDDGDNLSTLQKRADIAMYRAKGRGPNHIEFFSPGMGSHTEAALEIEQIIRKALDEGLFELYYQPQCTALREVIGFEALVRLPARYGIGPATFIPVAENAGLIAAVTRWVLREACRQAREWLDEGLALTRISVNVSALDIARHTFADEVESVLSGIPLHPEILEIELTESAIVGNLAESTKQMRRLRDLGVRMAIDDFGTGYSSLSYLQNLPIDALKIDRSFIQTINAPDDRPPLVHAIMALGRNMGLDVIAEGIETEAQMTALSAGGCDYTQGYLLGRPEPASHARKLLLCRAPEFAGIA